MARPIPTRPRNDPGQYDDLAAQWWQADGPFQALHWLAAARARAVPPASRAGGVLVDVACGGGLLAPHVSALGYRHVGVDLSEPSLRQAARHRVTPIRADALRLPLRDGIADVVVAGEMLEHVPDLTGALRELARILRPGGTLVADTLADTTLARFITITVGERIPGVPAGLHDGSLYIDRARLRREAAALGVPVTLTGLRPVLADALGWLLGRRSEVRFRRTRFTGVLFQAIGRRELP